MRTILAVSMALVLSASGQVSSSGKVRSSGKVLTGLTNVAPVVPTCSGPPNYNCSTTGTTTVGTLHSLFGQPTHPSPLAFNSTAYGVLNSTTDCYTRMTDGAVAKYTGGSLSSAIGQGNMTASGGMNDLMISYTGKYWAVHENGSNAVFQSDVSGPCAKNITNNASGGELPSVFQAGVFGFSRNSGTEGVFYTVSGSTLHQFTINSSSIPMTAAETSNANFPFNFDNCPGPVGTGAATSNSILGIALNDASFQQSLSWAGGQGTGRIVTIYTPGTGCASIDYYLGNWFAYAGSNGAASATSVTCGVSTCTFTMSATCAYTNGEILDVDQPNATTSAPPDAYVANWTVSTACSGGSTWVGAPTTAALPAAGTNTDGWSVFVPSGQETACFVTPYSGNGGIHDSQLGLNGLYSHAAGACTSQFGADTGAAIWQIGSSTVIAVSSGNTSTCAGSPTSNWIGHASLGVTHANQTNNPNPNTRQMYPVTCGNLTGSGVTSLHSINPSIGGVVDNHGWWPHPTGDDTYPWIESNSAKNNYTTPLELQNEIYGLQMSGSSAPVIRFGNTYNSNTSTFFGCNNAIGSGSQDGNWFYWLTDDMVGLGSGLCSIYAIHMQ